MSRPPWEVGAENDPTVFVEIPDGWGLNFVTGTSRFSESDL